MASYRSIYFEEQLVIKLGKNGILTDGGTGKKTAQVEAVNQQLHDFIKKRVEKTIVSSFIFPMKDWHLALRSESENGKPTGKRKIPVCPLFQPDSLNHSISGLYPFSEPGHSQQQKARKENRSCPKCSDGPGKTHRGNLFRKPCSLAFLPPTPLPHV